MYIYIYICIYNMFGVVAVRWLQDREGRMSMPRSCVSNNINNTNSNNHHNSHNNSNIEIIRMLLLIIHIIINNNNHHNK